VTPFPWGEAMRLGLGVLRLPPDAFWRMTPRELAAAASALGGARAGTAPNRGQFEALSRRFPDKEADNG